MCAPACARRVLDLLLDACAQVPTSQAAAVCARGVELLNAPAVGQLLGFKLAMYQVHPPHRDLSCYQGC